MSADETEITLGEKVPTEKLLYIQRDTLAYLKEHGPTTYRELRQFFQVRAETMHDYFLRVGKLAENDYLELSPSEDA